MKWFIGPVLFLLVTVYIGGAPHHGIQAIDDDDTEDPVDDFGPGEIITKPRLWHAPYLPDSFKFRIKELRDLHEYPGAWYGRPGNFHFTYLPTNNQLEDKIVEHGEGPLTLLDMMYRNKYEGKLTQLITDEFFSLYWRYALCKRGEEIHRNCPDPCHDSEECSGDHETGVCESYTNSSITVDLAFHALWFWSPIFQRQKKCHCENGFVWSIHHQACIGTTTYTGTIESESSTGGDELDMSTPNYHYIESELDQDGEADPDYVDHASSIDSETDQNDKSASDEIFNEYINTESDFVPPLDHRVPPRSNGLLKSGSTRSETQDRSHLSAEEEFKQPQYEAMEEVVHVQGLGNVNLPADLKLPLYEHTKARRKHKKHKKHVISFP